MSCLQKYWSHCAYLNCIKAWWELSWNFSWNSCDFGVEYASSLPANSGEHREKRKLKRLLNQNVGKTVGILNSFLFNLISDISPLISLSLLLSSVQWLLCSLALSEACPGSDCLLSCHSREDFHHAITLTSSGKATARFPYDILLWNNINVNWLAAAHVTLREKSIALKL